MLRAINAMIANNATKPLITTPLNSFSFVSITLNFKIFKHLF